MNPIVISESAVEPILLAEARLNLRVTLTTEDSRITRLIKAARQLSEQELEMSLVQKTLEVAQSSFYPYPIELPYGPVRDIVSVTYKDPDGVDVVMPADQYAFSVYTPTVLLNAYGVTWPTVRRETGSVRVRYTVGYPSADSPQEEVPEPIRQAMHLYISHYFNFREAVDEGSLEALPLGVKHLLGTYRQGLGV